jgi:hypothetical protein
MEDGLETLKADLIRGLLKKAGLTLFQLQKLRDSGVSINVWRKVLKGKPVRPTSRVKIAEFLKVDPSTLLLLDEKARTQPEGKDQPSLRPRVYRGSAEFSELCALADGRVRELTRPCYYGKSENATLTIRGAKAELIIDDLTMYDDASCSKEFERFSGRLQGRGRVVDGSANIRYTAVDQTRLRSWAGVCVLTVPATGKIHGYWMTAGHTELGRTVLGKLELA